MLRAFASAVLLLALFVTGGHAQSPDDSPPGALTLRPGDVIKLTVWREKDMTGEFLINEQGVVTLPLLGPKQATGISVAELRAAWLEEFSTHLRNPAIEITPLRRISVLGEVNSPGQYQVDPTISLAGVVALAHGPTGAGNLRHIRILRDGKTIHERARAEFTLANVDVRSGDQIFVERRSWISRNSGFFISTALSVAVSVVSISLLN